MNSPFRHLLLALGTLLFCATAAQAQQLQLSAPTYFNHLKPAPALGTNAQGTNSPIPGSQFSSVGITSGSAGPRSTVEPRFAEGKTDGVTSIKLTSARVGNAFGTSVPRYYLGDLITPPLVQADKVTPAPAGYWRAKPVRRTDTFTGVLRDVNTNGTLTNPVWNKTPEPEPPYEQEGFYYSPHADAVFASQLGAVEIVWVTTTPQGGEWKFWRETFNVSGATQRETRTIYWTEKSFNGPRVNIPGGRIERVNPVYSASFPPTVAEEYVPVGEVTNTDPNGTPSEEKRTLWFDKIGGSAQIAAHNLEGRVLVEYLGREITPNRHEFLGADVVEVVRRAPTTEVTTELGRRVLPHVAMLPNQEQPPLGTDTTLIASPVLDLSVDGGLSFYGTQGLTNGRLAYWAERENLNPDRVVFYWLEDQAAVIHLPGTPAPDISVFWPKYQDRYLFIWPPTLDAYAQVITDAGGSTAQTGLQFESGSRPEIVFQDDFSQAQARFDPDTQRLVVDFGSSGDTTNRTLLKFTSGTSLWYQPVYTQAQGRLLAQDTSFTPLTTTLITVPSTANLTVGMQVTGPGITRVPTYLNPNPLGTATIVSITDATHYVLSQHIAPGTNTFTYYGTGTPLTLSSAMSIVPGSTNPFYFTSGEWRVSRPGAAATAILESSALPMTANRGVFLEMVHSYAFSWNYDLGQFVSGNLGQLFVSRNGGPYNLVNFREQDHTNAVIGRAWGGSTQLPETSLAEILSNGNAGDTYRFRLQAQWPNGNGLAGVNWAVSGISVGQTFTLSSTSPPEIATVANTEGLELGMVVTGPGITGLVTIQSIISSTQIGLSRAIEAGVNRLIFSRADTTAPLFGTTTAPLFATTLVGDRIEPPSDKYSVAGALVGGRCYQASAYIDPYVSGVVSAEAGAIIPVNAPPTFTNGIPDNQLTVRWFEKVSPPAGTIGFSAFYVPSQVGRYAVDFPSESDKWRNVASMNVGRRGHDATVLQDGRVLVAGGSTNQIGSDSLTSAEIYDPTTGQWSATTNMNTAIGKHRAVLLQNGRVLICDGGDGYAVNGSVAQLFDPGDQSWTTIPSTLGSHDSGGFATMTLLNDGRVLLAGGGSGVGGGNCDLYDPVTNTWSLAATMNHLYGHSATLLADGRVFVAGGFDQNYDTLATGEIYNPANNTWTTTAAAPAVIGFGKQMVRLDNGKVLIAQDPPLLYDPVANSWSAAGVSPRAATISDRSGEQRSSNAVLPDKRVLFFAEGASNGRTTEIYDPAANTWSVGPTLPSNQDDGALVALQNGDILMVGGVSLRATAILEIGKPRSEIVMASNEGTEGLTTEQAAGFIYQQNNPASIGFNPNEEHAVKRNDRFWALRDDLNVTSGTGYTSEPFVLVAYTDPVDGRPAMRPYRVLREDGTSTFNYDWTAGLKIQGPMPLPLLPLPVGADGKIVNTEVPGIPDNAPNGTAPGKYNSFTLEDRQGYKWVYRGLHNGSGPGTFGMKWYYPMDADFYVPGGAQPAVGTKLPYLRPLSAGVPVGDAVTGTALTVSYSPKWPENVPSMRVAETLTLPKFDLPEVRNQKSAEVYYQQSIAKNGAAKTSVTLHDPTRAKKVSMLQAGFTDGIPKSIRTTVYQGKTYFQGLPPHLQTRFFFAPLESASGSLVLTGEFYDEIAGEDYLDLNVLSAEDELALHKLADNETPTVKAKWTTAISFMLKTRLETFIEDPARKGTFLVSTHPALTRDVLAKELAIMPDSDTARDSYALTATGQGTGYVTLVFADGSHPGLTPAGDPPAVKIIRVLPELYKGDLKVRLSSNPLDEKVTLRHSGDFAAKPEDYEFEWQYSGPVDGKQPKTYTYTNEIYLGDPDDALTRAWKYVQNPAVPRPEAAAYPTATWELPRALTIKDAAYDPASGLPDLILKANQDVDFTSGVPSLITFSADTDHLTGFVLYVNGAAALVHGNGVAALDALISENAYDLRLTRAASLDDLPVEGESLVVVAEIAAKLHFRIFNAAGVQVFDANEAQLSGKSAEIAVLKTRLSSLWAVTNLLTNDKIAIVSAAAAISGVDLDQDASTGLSDFGLTKQFRVQESYFIAGPNRIEVALYMGADVGISSNVNLRLEGSTRTDLVVGAGNWTVAASPATTENPKIQNRAIVGGSDGPMNSPLVIMSDQFFTMRYRPLKTSGNVLTADIPTQDAVPWSDWTRPALVEGWIKRVLAAINPFNQRMTDLYNNAVNTDVSLLTQAGTKWEGDIALTLDNLSDASLIAIYETVLNRGKDISINSGYDADGVNTALLLAAGYLNDLYTILGDEAFADAANPTISLDDQNTITEVNTSRFSFEGQVASSLEEELALLRGRDDFLSPQVTQSPFYNRLFWNYTRGINSGEALYAVNYNIKEKVGSSTENGILNAADAQRMFPQGHGDAYGHYLTALKGYYKLLTNRSFTWKPQIESLNILGNTVNVDYKDERKFAQAAAKVATAAEQVVALTHRQQYNDNPRDGWAHFRDGQQGGEFNNARHWGLDEWASRAGQGSYYHWVVGNAMVEEEETVLTGIQKIDRSTVLELQRLPVSGDVFQTTLDNANAHLNPLGLSPGAIAFDISPAELKAGNSHYEQVYGRALGAVLNAKGSFDQAGRMTRLLRNQENQIDDFNTAIEEEERGFNYKLIDLYGTPYPGDVGPGKTYAQNYSGPDLNNWFVVDRPSAYVGGKAAVTVQMRVPVNETPFSGFSVTAINQAYDKQTAIRSFKIQPDQIVQFSDTYVPGTDLGRRSVTGRLQQTLNDVQLTYTEFREGNERMKRVYEKFRRKSDLFVEELKYRNTAGQKETASARQQLILTLLEIEYKIVAAVAEKVKEEITKKGDAVAEALPKNNGTSNDVTSAGRGAAKGSSNVGATIVGGIAIVATKAAEGFAYLKEKEKTDLQATLDELKFSFEQKQVAYEFEIMYQEMIDAFYEVSQLALKLQSANEEVRTVMALGDRLQLDREIFRQRAAAIVQGYRTKDLTFRVFRNEALEQYRTLFDLASRYTYLAAKSYDYETGLLGSTQGQTVFRNIVASRALGDLTNGVPQATVSTLGDSGLAGTMAQLNADFSVAEGRLGINNPDQNGTLFSLRKELFRLPEDPATTADDDMWQQTLEQHIVSDLMADPDVAAQCLNLRKPDGTRVPGIIITFGSTIEHGKNYFGLGTAAGDHNYSPSNFATKIYSAGVVLPGYIGMDPYAFGSPNSGSPNTNGANALNATPYLYLIPVGMDRMLAPPLGDTNTLRSWSVHDQALPLPYNLGGTAFNGVQFFNANGTLSEQPWILRKHQAFRPVDDPAFFYSTMPQEFTSSRLIGRSVWNTTWKIVIPAYSLLENEQDGLNRFTATVRDIQLFLRTYSNAGN